MALKKSQLYRSLWKSCDELRGGMDAAQYKDYVLTLLFVKYVSDKYKGDPFAVIKVPKGASFDDMVALKGDPEIGDKMNKIVARLAEANDLMGVINLADFNDESKLGKGKDLVERLSKLIAIFEGIDLQANRAEGDDLLGDAYEYLMRHFATESGKSKGQFYTPAEVSRVMAQIVGAEKAKDSPTRMTVYDPTCGSGSLLIKVADAADGKLTIYGQESNSTTAALARMNMILHGYEAAEIWHGNTLTDPHWKAENGGLKTFDFVVANPPFSQKNWTTGLDPVHDRFERFEYGVPPAKKGDYAFLLHVLKSMKSTGKAAVIMPHGVLFRGHSEAKIRRELVRRGFIKGIIGLPPNLFYGTGIPAVIIVLDKEHAHARKGIFMIDASKGFRKDGPKNRLRERDIHKIVSTFKEMREIPGCSRMVPLSEIEANDYNLNLPRYIDSSEPEDRQDLAAHLFGGIPQRDLDALKDYWDALPRLRDDLFAPKDRPGYWALKIPARKVRAFVLRYPDFDTFRQAARAPFDAWRDAWRSRLLALERSDKPKIIKTLIHDLSEDLLARYADVPLIDPYDIYQRLMDYWDETMQDDVYLVVGNGWVEAAKPRVLNKGDNSAIHETPDLVVDKVKYKMDLLPPDLVVARYFAKEKDEIDQLKTELEDIAQKREQIQDERSGEGDILYGLAEQGKNIRLRDLDEQIAEYEALALQEFAPQDFKRINDLNSLLEGIGDKLEKLSSSPVFGDTCRGRGGKITQTAVKKRLRQIQSRDSIEGKALTKYLKLAKEERRLKGEIKKEHDRIKRVLGAIREKHIDAPIIRDLNDLYDFRQLILREKEISSEVKEKQKALNRTVLAKYEEMSEEEIKALVVDDKWLATLENAVCEEIEHTAQRLAARVSELAERYEEPLPQIEREVAEWRAKVAVHLQQMGFALEEMLP